MYKKQAQQQFGQWICTIREQQEKKRSHFAQSIGYKNINKGCRLILRWEQGKEDPAPQYHDAIQNFLAISPALWAEKRSEYQTLIDFHTLYSKAYGKISAETETLLATHHQLLCAHLKTILDTPNFRHIQLHGLLFSMAYIHGGSTVQLGPLIQTWAEGRLQAEDIWVFSGGCSPLSGSHRLYGFNIHSKEIKKHMYLFPSAPSQIGPMIMRCKEMGMGFSHWSLTQFLSILGIDLPPAQIYADHELWGQYDFPTATLTIHNQQYRFPLTKEEAHIFHPTNLHIEPEWDIPKGKMVIGDLFTNQSGIYKGEKWKIDSEEGVWLCKPGYLVAPHGMPVMRWTSDIPLMVQEKLISLWTTHQSS